MARLSPAVIESMKSVGVPNKRPFDNYWDGCHSDHNARDNIEDPREDKGSLKLDNSGELLFYRPNHQLAFWGCLRAQFFEQLASGFSPDVVHFNKELVRYSDPASSSQPVTLYFADGTTATADALIGCDGIRSHVRAQLLSIDAPLATNPNYTHKRCYRTIVPLAEGERVLEAYKANDQCMHVGPGAHVLTYPVGDNMLNVVIFITDRKEWLDGQRMTNAGRREEVQAALKDWGPAVRGLAALLPADPLVWGIFDMFEHPAPWYAQARVCIAGDAAHASARHHGAGAGFGVEDALALVTAVEETLGTIGEDGCKAKCGTYAQVKIKAISVAFRAFNQVRYECTQ